MRRLPALLLAFLLAVTLLSPVSASEAETASGLPPATDCAAYAVIDADSGQVLLTKNGTRRWAPASTTKIMTMALALESGLSPTDTLTTSETAVADIDYDSTQLYLAVGETLTVEQFLYGAEVRSANDAANVLAEGVDGTQAAFAARMNAKAESLGLVGTHFANAHGLPEDDHYTTALDLAAIARWALTVPGFAEIFSTYQYTIPANGVADERPMTTTCEILNPAQRWYYPAATGAKLGWTAVSDYTLVTAAEKDGVRLLCVVLGDAAADSLYSDTISLLDHAFGFFRSVTVTAAEASYLVPVFDGGTHSANVAVTGAPFTLLLHTRFGADDVRFEDEVPERYAAGDEIAPRISYTLADAGQYQYADLGAQVLEWAEIGVGEYTASQPVSLDATGVSKSFAEAFRELMWVIVPGAFLVLFLVVSMFVQLANRGTRRLRYDEPGKRRYRW